MNARASGYAVCFVCDPISFQVQFLFDLLILSNINQSAYSHGNILYLLWYNHKSELVYTFVTSQVTHLGY